jgi:hypothetical protein
MNVRTVPLDFVKSCSVLLMFLKRDREINIIVEPETFDLTLEFFKLCCDYNYILPSPKPIPDTTQFLREIVLDWQDDFVNTLSMEEVFHLFAFCDYIDFPPLRRLMAQKIAFEIKKCKDAEEIRCKFNLTT